MLAVLGKASSIANVDRVDLTIIDSEHALTSKKAATENGSTDITGGDEEEYEDGYAAEAELRGIEAKLIMKLVCKYGALISPTSAYVIVLTCNRSYEEALIASRDIRLPTCRGRSRLHPFVLQGLR